MLVSNCDSSERTRGGQAHRLVAEHVGETVALDVVHHQEAGAVRLEVGLHAHDAVAGAGDTAEQHQRLRLAQEAFPAFLEQRRVVAPMSAAPSGPAAMANCRG